ncbi:winged helix-turn-helix transcriptional regulator [Humibacter albus]|jgi:DNA-binding HxlR family transcriptional regulator|uniref:winged helix-turn-helix transcriptional regulator n=1 Tax=Humibacter albus TaxID=427754 RepID=UPI0003B6191C|nr:helix-turn-helix domain-containing protein [Humibacter albus]
MEACATGKHDTHNVYEAQCPCRSLLELLANKWTALAIGGLEAGPMRFGALKKLLGGVSPKVLTQTLRRLEDSGLVLRTVYPSVPAHVEYELTQLGRSVAEPLRDLRVWVERHLDDVVGPDRGRDLTLLGR